MLKRNVLSPEHFGQDICDACTAQGWIAAGQAFVSGKQAPLHHPNCRCHAEYASPPQEREPAIEDIPAF